MDFCRTRSIERKKNDRTTKPIKVVRRPSNKNSQNQPGFPPTPRIFKIPAASNEEIILAIWMIQYENYRDDDSSSDLTLSVDQKAASRTESSLDL